MNISYVTYLNEDGKQLKEIIPQVFAKRLQKMHVWNKVILQRA